LPSYIQNRPSTLPSDPDWPERRQSSNYSELRSSISASHANSLTCFSTLLRHNRRDLDRYQRAAARIRHNIEVRLAPVQNIQPLLHILHTDARSGAD
jgi:hypothetical protein